jgi:hypothetical protein
MMLDGEVQLGADGVLQGWCWNPKRPTERLVLEILINERIVSTFVASRFREDLRGRNIGDGYYGFIATLTKSLLDAGDNSVISARERATGCCFWRQVRGESGLPKDFEDRFTETQKRFSRIAQSNRFRTLGTISFTPRISTELRVLGMHLRAATRLDKRYLPPIARARAALLQHIAPAVLAIVRRPRVGLIIIADSTCGDVLSAISAIVPTLNSIEASLLLIDRGLNAEVALAPSLFGNLQYIYDPRDDLESLLAAALKYSHGDLLIFMRNPGESIVQGLPEIAAQMHDSGTVYINERSAEIAAGISADTSEHVSTQCANFPIGLEFGGKRETFERIRSYLSPKDRVTGFEDVDLAIRAIRDGLALCVWDEPDLKHKSGRGAKATH